MALIDEKGWVFGRVNVIDLGAILLLTVFMILLLRLFFIGRPTSWTYVELEVKDDQSTLADLIKKGDTEQSAYKQGDSIIPVREYWYLLTGRPKSDRVVAEIVGMHVINASLDGETLLVGVNLLTEWTFLGNKPAYNRLWVKVGGKVAIETDNVKFDGRVRYASPGRRDGLKMEPEE